jgi:hypothetical protein
MRYRKTHTVEATQWWNPGDHHAVEMRRWDTVRRMSEPDGMMPDEALIPVIHTLEGLHRVTPGDWIITGQQGEHYACKPEIFAATYEPAP